ncbi:hypothetical protein PS1_005678 [Malus domestica]
MFGIHLYNMMQQKILVKVQMHSDKCRTKALKIAAAACGVSKVSLEGENKDHLEVTGDGVDSVRLTGLLRKKVGFAAIVQIKQVKDVTADDGQNPITIECTSSASYYCTPQCPPMYYGVVREYPEPTCSIM